MNAESHWAISCPPDTFLRLRSDESFAVLVALSRCVNHIRFVHASITQIEDDDESPRAARQQTAVILAVAAALKEGIDLVRKRLGRHMFLRDLSAFALLTALFKDPRFRTLIDHGMPTVRHGFVSHFLEDHAAEEMADVSFADECVFAIGRGAAGEQAHFRVADSLALLALSRGRPGDTLDTRTAHIGGELGDLSARFVEHSEQLIFQALRHLGFTVKKSGPPA